MFKKICLVLFICFLCILGFQTINYLENKQECKVRELCIKKNIKVDDIYKYNIIASSFVIPEYVIDDVQYMKEFKKNLKILYGTDNIDINIKDYINNYKLVCIIILAEDNSSLK
jgi:hypothetical protein